MTSRDTVFLVFIFLIGVSKDCQPALAMRTPGPVHLHEILAQADVVVVASVVECEVSNDPCLAKAVVRVEQVVHGKVNEKLIHVANADANCCGGPPAVFVVGERLLLFLFEHTGNHYTVCGFLYGAKVLDDDQREACVRRTEEFFRIRAIPDAEKRALYWAEWAVRCAETSSTLRDGLSLLGRGTRGDLTDKALPGDPTRYYPLLDRSQTERLIKSLKQFGCIGNNDTDTDRLMRVIAFALQHEQLLSISEKANKLITIQDEFLRVCKTLSTKNN